MCSFLMALEFDLHNYENYHTKNFIMTIDLINIIINLIKKHTILNEEKKNTISLNMIT